MKKIAVALSGGVDSAAAALLLKKEGYEVLGITYRLQQDQEKDIADAANVCKALNIEHIVLDYRELFKNFVMNPFVDSYLKAETPNPCIFCNKTIKFGKFIEDTKNLGCDFISTGHYAKITKDDDGIYHLFKGDNEKKDQSYVLYNLNQDTMARMVLPLGFWNYSKDELREMLREANIPIADRPESQDICFIKEGTYCDFIEENRPDAPKKGSFVDESGNILGQHKGFYHYTIGQRKGLGIALGAPAFVTDIDFSTGNVTLSLDEKKLLADTIYIRDFNFLGREKPEFPYVCLVKTRYKSHMQQALITEEGSLLKVKLENAGRAPTKGQSAVFYKDNEVIGGGIIDSVEKL